MARSEQSRCFHALFGLGQLIGVRADVRQAHGRGGKIALDSQRGLGHDGLVAVAVERVDERGELVGEALRLMDVAAVERLDQLAHRRGGDVRDHRDDAHGADRQERQEQAIITRIPGEAGALLLFDGGGEVDGHMFRRGLSARYGRARHIR